MKVEGTQKLLKKIREFGKEAENRIDYLTRDVANDIAIKAERRLLSYNDIGDVSEIAQSINALPDGKLKYSISVNRLPMGAYIEFGTGIFVEVATEWKDIAWAFYKNGKGWTEPHPYLYPAYIKGKDLYQEALQALLDSLTRRFNN